MHAPYARAPPPCSSSHVLPTNWPSIFAIYSRATLPMRARRLQVDVPCKPRLRCHRGCPGDTAIPSDQRFWSAILAFPDPLCAEEGPGLFRRLPDEEPHLRVRCLEIRRQTVAPQLLGGGRSNGRDHAARESPPHVGLEAHLRDDLPQ